MLSRAARAFRRGTSYSLNGLDLEVARYVKKGRGFFVEAGANNGVAQSNTLYLEKHRGWTGLLIEPIPELAAECRWQRPNCIVESCALVGAHYPDDSVRMRCCNLMSVVKGSLKTEEAELEHLRLGQEVQGISQSYELNVPARTLSEILDAHHVSQIDFLSLDVEGYELNALMGIDFERHRPHFMLIEARFRGEIDSFLAPRYVAVREFTAMDVLYRFRG